MILRKFVFEVRFNNISSLFEAIFMNQMATAYLIYRVFLLLQLNNSPCVKLLLTDSYP